jgi:signal transduction histidine kinase
MGARALKTKITLNLALLLLLGMLSVDFVTTVTAQRNLIRAETSKGKALSGLITGYLDDHAVWEKLLTVSDFRGRVGPVLNEAGACGLVLIDRNQRLASFGSNRCAAESAMAAYAKQALASGTESVQFLGSTFGFFWMQPEYLVIATPLRRNEDLEAGFSLVFPLEGIYRSLWHSQQILFPYIAINVAILVFIGVYQVVKLYLQPLARLAQRAEDYKEDDAMLFAVRKEDNELQRLSSSLNSLMRRLAADKKKLRDTVASLETANAELKRAQTEIIRAEKLASVGRLSAGIAHEIGNPIGIVTGYLELLKHQEASEDERVEFLDRAQQEIERISTIIRQLLEISRPASGSCQPFSVHALIGDMVEGLNLQPFMAHIRLQPELHAPDDVAALDSNQLRQVFLNLIINAADAVSAKGPDSRGELVIATENARVAEPVSGNARNWLYIHFKDNGTGIPAEHLDSIFDPFFTTKEPGKGTGLGLAVSFMIMESVGGSLRAESALGQGTVMTVSLPVVPESAEAKPICRSPLDRGEACPEAPLGSGTPESGPLRMRLRPVPGDRTANGI